MKADCVRELSEEELLMLTVFPEFMGGLSHELAQPLNAISLACEVLRFKLGRLELNDIDKNFFEDKLAAIKKLVVRSSEIIKELRRYTPNSINTSEDDVETSFARVYNLLRQQFISRGIEFNIETRKEEQSNPVKLDSILLDLIIAQCLVLARNNVEFLESKCREKGFNFQKKIEALLCVSNDESRLLLRWDKGILDRNYTDHSTSLDRLRLFCSKQLLDRIGGTVGIEAEYISLEFRQKT